MSYGCVGRSELSERSHLYDDTSASAADVTLLLGGGAASAAAYRQTLDLVTSPSQHHSSRHSHPAQTFSDRRQQQLTQFESAVAVM